MSRLGGQSEARFPVIKPPIKICTHLSTQCSGNERLSRFCPARSFSSPAKIKSKSEYSALTRATKNLQDHGTFLNDWLVQSESFYSPVWKFHSRSPSTFQIWDGGSLREPYA
ncbi:hypothetical protein TNCV_3318901 [Trichonephila clavipes]|nr:hypothetical protein TNCV_3318901 [Trichonephila clavipes]